MSGQCVYAIVTPSDGVATFFKIGRTMRIENRIKGVQTGCPFPIEHVLHLPVPSALAAIAIEGRLHARLSEYHSAGEWFRFDLTNPAHKIEFRVACQEVIAPILGDGWRWTMYGVAEIEAIGAAASAKARIERVSALVDRLAAQDEGEARRIASGLSGEWWKK